MARAIITAPFSAEFFGGREDHVVDAPTIFALIRSLDGMAPGFAQAAEERAAIAVNGIAVADWTKRLEADDEVLFVQRIAGGQSRSCPVFTAS